MRRRLIPIVVVLVGALVLSTFPASAQTPDTTEEVIDKERVEQIAKLQVRAGSEGKVVDHRGVLTVVPTDPTEAEKFLSLEGLTVTWGAEGIIDQSEGLNAWIQPAREQLAIGESAAGGQPTHLCSTTISNPSLQTNSMVGSTAQVCVNVISHWVQDQLRKRPWYSLWYFTAGSATSAPTANPFQSASAFSSCSSPSPVPHRCYNRGNGHLVDVGDGQYHSIGWQATSSFNYFC